MSAFFPKSTPSKSALQACIDTGLPVFARDTGEDGRKTFFACGYDHFANVLYRRKNMRHVYEVLQYDKPTKIYFDIDRKIECEGDVQTFERDMRDFINLCLEDIRDTLGMGSAVSYYVLDSSSDVKLSRHVIFNVILSDVAMMYDYFEHIMKKASESARNMVDRSVYTRNRSFRLIYSTKMGKTTPLLLMGETSNEYCPQTVLRTMIQACRNAASTEFVQKKRPAMHISNGWSRVDLPKGLEFFITTFDKNAVVRTIQEDDDFISCIVGGITCPWTKRVHKSNNTFFNFSKTTLTGWFRCADIDCPAIHFGRQRLTWAMSDTAKP